MKAEGNSVRGQRITRGSKGKRVGETSFLLTGFAEGTDEHKVDSWASSKHTFISSGSNMQPSISFKQRNYTKKGQETLEEKRKIMSQSTEGEQKSQKNIT